LAIKSGRDDQKKIKKSGGKKKLEGRRLTVRRALQRKKIVKGFEMLIENFRGGYFLDKEMGSS